MVADALESLGIRLAVTPELGPVRAQSLRAALQLRATVIAGGARVIGLQPATADVAAVGLGLQLGAALGELGEGPVAMLAPRLALPGGAPMQEPGLASIEALPGLTLVGARPGARATAPEMERAIAALGGHARMLLLDLTAFRELVSSVDAVVLVAVAGGTREGDLLRQQRALGGRVAGVLLLRGQAA